MQYRHLGRLVPCAAIVYEQDRAFLEQRFGARLIGTIDASSTNHVAEELDEEASSLAAESGGTHVIRTAQGQQVSGYHQQTTQTTLPPAAGAAPGSTGPSYRSSSRGGPILSTTTFYHVYRIEPPALQAVPYSHGAGAAPCTEHRR